MTINLEEFVNKEVVILFQDGTRKATVMRKSSNDYWYPYFIKNKYGDNHYYSRLGHCWNPSFSYFSGNIVDIQLKKSQKTMALSDKTIEKLASAIAPEAIKYVGESEEYIQFMSEQFTKFMNEKIGPMDEEIAVEIIGILVSQCVCGPVSELSQDH